MPATPEQPPLTDPFEIGGIRIENRVLLAPLAGIGNWFVRLQAKRHGAGLTVSEMVSSFGLHHRNERTLRELMRIHPDEHPVSIQLFGHDAEAMRSGAAIAAEVGADLIDINMGCPVRKVRRTGAGVELLTDPELALALVEAAREGSGRPVTVKLRSGLRAEDRSGFDLAVRLAEEGGAAAIAFHPRAASAGHKGAPDYELTRELAERLEVPVIVSGGLKSAEAAEFAYRESGADAVMIARGALGNPWVFEELTGRRDGAAAARGGRRRAALDDRPRRGAPGERARQPAICASSTPGTSIRCSSRAMRRGSSSRAPTSTGPASSSVQGAGRDRSPQAPDISAESALTS